MGYFVAYLQGVGIGLLLGVLWAEYDPRVQRALAIAGAVIVALTALYRIVSYPW